MNQRPVPIRRALITFVLVTSGIALLLTASGLFVSEWVTFRRATIQRLETLGEVIATNSTAALAFADAQGATETLKALKADPHVVAAALYDASGALFATYPEERSVNALPSSEEVKAEKGLRFANGRLAGFLPVTEGERRMGTLFVQYDMGVMYERMRLYGLVAAFLIAFSCLVAYLVSRRLQLQISGPILSLAETAKAVSDRRDYSVRAKKPKAYELGLLTDAFNHMLTRIQEQLNRLNLLQHITRGIGERHDLPSIFQVVLRSVEDHMPIDFAAVCRYDAETEALTVTTVGARSHALAVEMALDEHANVPIDQNGLSRCVRGELVYEPDVRKLQFAFPQRLARGGLRSLVVAPLQVESQVFGVLIAASRREEAFQSADCEFLLQLSAHVALASNQAQLYGSLQRAYDDLRQTQHTVLQQERLRALGQMASGIAHDINNAISPVSLYTQFLLEREPSLSERARDCLKTIQQAIDDVAATVARMREFYRPREPQLVLAKVDLNRLVRQVLELTRARWRDVPQQYGSMIELQAELAENVPEFMGADAEIRDALTNLIFNAVDAMPAGGTLTVRTRVSDRDPGGRRCVDVEVTDSGVGMDEETRRRCLEPFFTTKGERGTGLGLAMVYGMVQRHSAELEIESRLGQGTTVRLSFPAPKAALDGKVSAAASSVPSQRLRILLVDDDPLLSECLRVTLEADGHLIESADGGQAGIDAFLAAHRSGRPFAVVVTDLGMPYVDGRKVASAVNAVSPSTPVILLTGWGQRMVAENDLPAHVSRVLSKPPKMPELRAALAEVTDAPVEKLA
ncbi:MAG: ATP-binding protein [Gammaproteobacteria bacterium]